MKHCPVDILQYEWEFDALLDLFKRAKPKVVLEIGSLYGGTLYQWLMAADWEITVIAVDLFSTIDYNETEKLWRSWLKDGQTLHAIKGNSASEEIISLVKEKTPNGIDWLFIDGDHEYEGVKADYNNYPPLVNNNGYYSFHDITGQGGVATLWNEIKHGKPIIEIRHTKHPLGIGIIQKWNP